MNRTWFPLLDMVLQLVMFFMVCANFVMEQVNQSIMLPTALEGKPLEKKQEHVIYLNVDLKGNVILAQLDAVGDERILTTDADVTRYMKLRRQEDTRANGGDETKPPRSQVVIRADGRAPTGKVYDIMKACRTAGYERAQLRVKQK